MKYCCELDVNLQFWDRIATFMMWNSQSGNEGNEGNCEGFPFRPAHCRALANLKNNASWIIMEASSRGLPQFFFVCCCRQNQKIIKDLSDFQEVMVFVR